MAKIFNLPEPEKMLLSLEGAYNRYGVLIILLSSIIEGLLLIGNYVPGGTMIFLGVILASSVLEAVWVVFLVTVGLYSGYLVSYLLGRYGWYVLLTRFGFSEAIERSKMRLEKHAGKAFATSYSVPNLAALTATAAGITKFGFRKFLLYSLASTVGWNIFWGTFVYTLGTRAFELTGFKSAFAVLGVWIVILIISDLINRNRTKNEDIGLEVRENL